MAGCGTQRVLGSAHADKLTDFSTTFVIATTARRPCTQSVAMVRPGHLTLHELARANCLALLLAGMIRSRSHFRQRALAQRLNAICCASNPHSSLAHSSRLHVIFASMPHPCTSYALRRSTGAPLLYCWARSKPHPALSHVTAYAHHSLRSTLGQSKRV